MSGEEARVILNFEVDSVSVQTELCATDVQIESELGHREKRNA